MDIRINSDYFPLVFITEAECVYCAVRNESLNIIQVNVKP